MNGWKMYGTSVSIKDSYVNWLSGNSASYKRFTGLYVLQPKAGRTYTLSLLARVNEVSGSVTLRPSHINGSQIPGAGGLRISAPTDSFELLAYTFTPTSISGPVGVEILVANGTGDYVDIDMVAWKLELGSQQSLAYQGDDGNWYMTAPPDYDLQYALCSMYSPSTGEWVGNQHSNQNLLDNWYFVDPVNQRGQTEYESGFGIDRWRGRGVQLKNGYLHVEGPMFQLIEAAVAKFYYGKRITLSILLADGSLYSGSNIVPSTVTTSNQWRHCCNVTNGQALGFYILANTGDMQIFRINSDTATAGLDVVAVKTELGSAQTLAHQDADGNWVLNDPPPNKALELAKCQRYYYQTANTALTIDGVFPTAGVHTRTAINGTRLNNVSLPVEMRATPTITIFYHDTPPITTTWRPGCGVVKPWRRYRPLHTGWSCPTIWRKIWRPSWPLREVLRMLCKWQGHLLRWLCGGVLYGLLETFWRGYTHWTMMVLAAVLCVPLDLANEHMPWELPLPVQAVLGGLAITAGELLAGLVLNVWLGLGIWDYSNQWGNLWGQICPLYAGLWCLLAGPVIVGFDWMDYRLCGGERPRYTLL